MDRILIAPELMAASASVYLAAYHTHFTVCKDRNEAERAGRSAVGHFVETMRKVEISEIPDA
jgi:hypothetical protein